MWVFQTDGAAAQHLARNKVALVWRWREGRVDLRVVQANKRTGKPRKLRFQKVDAAEQALVGRPSEVRGSAGQCVDEALAQGQFVVQFVQIGVGCAPIDLGKPEVQISQSAAHRNV